MKQEASWPGGLQPLSSVDLWVFWLFSAFLALSFASFLPSDFPCFLDRLHPALAPSSAVKLTFTPPSRLFHASFTPLSRLLPPSSRVPSSSPLLLLFVIYTIMTRLFQRTLIHSVKPLSLLHLIFPTISLSALAITPVVRPQYATANETLYIQGGSADGVNPSNLFYSLSLSIPWNDTAPPWVALPVNTSGILAPTLWQRTMSLSADNSQLVIWDLTGTPSTMFNISSTSWVDKILPVVQNSGVGQTALIDPNSSGLGTYYVPNGCPVVNSPPSANSTWSMCKFDMNVLNSNITTIPMLSDGMPSKVLYYSFVYSVSRNTFLLYGGVGDNQVANPNLFEFNSTKVAWEKLQATGDTPGDINSHCMVQTTDGTKMIVFGGVSTANLASSRLHILFLNQSNPNNLTWTQGADAGAGNARYGHACAINGNSFIVWGGQQNSATIMSSTPLIYNIPANEWVHNFVVSQSLPSSSPTMLTLRQTAPAASSNSSAQPASQGRPFNIGIIIGCAVGGVVIIAAVGYMFYRRHRNAKLEYYDFPPLPPLGEEDMEHFRVFRKKGLVGWDDDDTSMYDDSDSKDFTDKSVALSKKATKKGQFSSPSLETSSTSTLVLPQPQPPPPTCRKKRSKGLSEREYPSVVTVTHRLLTEDSQESPKSRRKPMSQHSSLSTASSPSTLNNSIASVVSSSTLPSPTKVTVKKVSDILSTPIPSHQVHSKGRSRMTPLKTPTSSSIVPSTRHSPQYVPIGYEGLDIWRDCGQEGARSPQLSGPTHETSPAAWMAMMNTKKDCGQEGVRSPQLSGPTHETSPAAWMAMMNTKKDYGQEGVRSPQLSGPTHETSPAAWMAMMNTTRTVNDTSQSVTYRVNSPQTTQVIELNSLNSNSSGEVSGHRTYHPTKPRRHQVRSERPDQEPKIK